MMNIKISEKKMAGSGAILSAICIILGAFGAHLLQNYLSIKNLETFQTACKYLMVHALAIIILSFLPITFSQKHKVWLWFILGILLFSGSLFAYSISFIWLENGIPILGMITPLGGMSFIIGWFTLSYYLLRK